MDDLSQRIAIMAAVLIVAPAAWALLLRWARCPGWPIAGGVIAALLLGPTIFGRIAPDPFNRVFVGGVQQQRELDQLLRRQQADLIAAQTARMDEQGYRELRERHVGERAQAERNLASARWRDQKTLRVLMMIVVALSMFAAAPFAVPRSNVAQSTVSMISIGLWGAALPGALAFAAMVWFWRSGELQSALVAAALAIGPWALVPGDRAAADCAEIGGARLIQSAGRLASIIAIAAVAAALWVAMRTDGLLLAAPLLALPLAWALPHVVSARVADASAKCILLPSLAACATIKVDWIDDFAVWPLIVILLLSDDGRWIGAFIGAMLPGGRRGLRTMRLVVGSMAAAPTQLAVTAIGAHSGVIAPRFVLPLVLGALLIEMTAPVRRAFAQRVAQTEEELER